MILGDSNLRKLVPLLPGVSLLALGSFLAFGLQVRMWRIGNKRALFLGGAFNWKEYHDERKKRGWSVWPVVLMWTLNILGIVLLIFEFYTAFGRSPIVPK
jgi:uncharacterized membrane protein HdeD (DUF308 family)